MSPWDVTIVVALVAAFGSFATGLASVAGGKAQKTIDLVSERLKHAESRLDAIEEELARERTRRMTLSVYTTALRAWSERAWQVIRRHSIEFDEPPTYDAIAVEDQAMVPNIEHRRSDT